MDLEELRERLKGFDRDASTLNVNPALKLDFEQTTLQPLVQARIVQANPVSFGETSYLLNDIGLKLRALRLQKTAE